MYNITLYMIAE